MSGRASDLACNESAGPYLLEIFTEKRELVGKLMRSIPIAFMTGLRKTGVEQTETLEQAPEKKAVVIDPSDIKT